MDQLAVGFWGAYFGLVVLMLAGSAFAFARSLHRVALRAGLAGVLSALFVVSYLGWLPIDDRAVEARLLSHIAIVCSALLGMMLLALMNVLQRPDQRTGLRAGIFSVTAALMALSWALPPVHALAGATGLAFLVGSCALAVCVRGGLRRERLAWLAAAGVFFLLLSLGGLSAIAVGNMRSWPVHIFSAVAGMAYLATISAALWARYSYLIELREIIAQGPSYDPVTRMRSHAETGQMVGAAFRLAGDETRPLGVIVVSISNLYGLEQLHGRGALNHALFVCASRLRRSHGPGVEMGRLGDDGFLILTRNSQDVARLIALAREVSVRLAQPVSLSISADPTAPHSSRATWVADVGVGVLATSPPMTQAASAVRMARAMSRTAWSYGSRIAWFDSGRREIAELPLTDGRR